jgi:hypothetical protein
LPPIKPLSNLALYKSEIESALNVITPLQLAPPQSSCDNSKALECFVISYTSSDGDLFILLLTRYSNQDEAFNFGIGMEEQLKQNEHAAEINIPTTSGNYRWLVSSFIAGTPVYSGGATERAVSIYTVWGRTSVFVSQDEAIQIFSRLLDEQINKIRSNSSN